MRARGPGLMVNNDHIFRHVDGCWGPCFGPTLLRADLLHDVREMVHEKLSVNHTKHGNFTIAVHIRRGDVALNARLKDRYLDNAYFLRAIEAAMRPGARVFIYSEGKP